MAIVAYGYGIDAVANVLVNDILLSLTDEPDITLDPDVIITLDADGVDIEITPDIDIEVD